VQKLNSPNQNTTEREFLSLNAAAEKIGCTRRFLETRIEDGELKVFRPSRRLVRISRAEFDRWVETYSTKGGAA
jgi:excisionase family DNA binding protein